MKNESNSFLEPKTLIAVVLVVVIWIGWQKYLENKYPEHTQRAASPTQEVKSTGNPEEKREESKGETLSKTAETQKIHPQEVEEVFDFESKNIRFQLSSKGMGFKSIVLQSYKDRKHEPVHIGGKEQEDRPYLPLETRIGSLAGDLFFKVDRLSQNKFEGKALVEGVSLVKTIEVFPETYSFEVMLEVRGLQANGVVSTYIVEEVAHPSGGGSFLAPSFDHFDSYISYRGTHSRVVFKPEEATSEEYPQAELFSLGSQYFALGVVNRSETIPNAKLTSHQGKNFVIGSLDYPILDGKDSNKIQFVAFAGPKSVSLLKRVDEHLPAIVDFGWFDYIAMPMLSLLRWFFSIFGNYGMAIILLTLVVRVLVLPFAVMSFKSMKAMQKIQPEMKVIREKYKNDPQTMNREVMVLMKENKANPMSSCLPMFLQFPVFIALYRVLGSSIELYQTPFMLWITDLSLKDPYYVLPVLMGITMFIQQKITPTQMDPAQQKVMLILPIFMTVIMASLPSGLTLYIFVSTLFGIFQQMFFMREKSAEIKTIDVKVKA